MTDYDINEIADARYMGLMCPPASPEARALVNDIINIIEQADSVREHGRRKTRLPLDQRLALSLVTF